jgi:hypothetical protein
MLFEISNAQRTILPKRNEAILKAGLAAVGSRGLLLYQHYAAVTYPKYL